MFTVQDKPMYQEIVVINVVGVKETNVKRVKEDCLT